MIRIKILNDAISTEIPNIQEILDALRPFTKVDGEYKHSELGVSLEFGNFSTKKNRLSNEAKYSMSFTERLENNNSTLKTYMILSYKQFYIKMLIPNTTSSLKLSEEFLKVNMFREHANRLISDNAADTIPEIDESLIKLHGPSDEEIQRMEELRAKFTMDGQPFLPIKEEVNPELELDRILEKIKKHGEDSLTDIEKDFLSKF